MEVNFPAKTSFKKWTNEFVFLSWLLYQDRKTNLMVQFLEEVLAGKFVFNFYWPLWQPYAFIYFCVWLLSRFSRVPDVNATDNLIYYIACNAFQMILSHSFFQILIFNEVWKNNYRISSYSFRPWIVSSLE